MDDRLHLLAPLRWRLAEVPFGLDYPYWVDAAGFDLDFHIRELALPARGYETTLTEQVARIVARPLDRAPPLWELYVIQGLQGGRVAVLTKLHHAAVDGASVNQLLSILFDDQPEPAPTAPPVNGHGHGHEPMPGQAEMLARGLAGLPRQPLRALRGLREVPRVLEGLDLKVPPTVLSKRITPHRRIALSSQSLAEVRQIKDRYGVTVNDVVVATCAGALRSWLDTRGELPHEPLVALVPVSVRTPEQADDYGNRVSAMLVAIPTDEPDPERRLVRAHETLRSAKERHDALPAAMMQDANNVVPPVLMARAARLSMLLASRLPGAAPINTCISNVPGSRRTRYLAGARVQATYPISAVADGVGLNITLFSYCDDLNYGVVVDRGIVDDPRPLAEALKAAQAELLDLVKT